MLIKLGAMLALFAFLFSFQNCSGKSGSASSSSATGASGAAVASPELSIAPTITSGAVVVAIPPQQQCAGQSYLEVHGFLVNDKNGMPVSQAKAEITSNSLAPASSSSTANGSFNTVLCLNSLNNLAFHFSASAPGCNPLTIEDLPFNQLNQAFDLGQLTMTCD